MSALAAQATQNVRDTLTIAMEHAGEQAALLVADARCELSDRGQPLGADALMLERLELRLVLADRDDGLDRTGWRPDSPHGRDAPHGAHDPAGARG